MTTWRHLVCGKCPHFLLMRVCCFIYCHKGAVLRGWPAWVSGGWSEMEILRRNQWAFAKCKWKPQEKPNWDVTEYKEQRFFSDFSFCVGNLTPAGDNFFFFLLQIWPSFYCYKCSENRNVRINCYNLFWKDQVDRKHLKNDITCFWVDGNQKQRILNVYGSMFQWISQKLTGYLADIKSH